MHIKLTKQLVLTVNTLFSWLKNDQMYFLY